MRKFLWLVSIFCTLIAGFVAIVAITTANGAPQEAAGAAIALNIAIIPYCLARAFSEFRSNDSK